MKQVTLIILAALLISCGNYKQDFFKTVEGKAERVEQNNGCINIFINNIEYICSYENVFVGEEVRIIYFFSPRNNKNNIQTVEKL